MQSILQNGRERPLFSGLLLLSFLVLCGGVSYTAPVFFTAVANGNGLRWTDWVLGLLLPLLAAGGLLALCLLRERKEARLPLARRLAAAAGMAIGYELLWAFLSQVIPGMVYSLISGSILTARIVLGFLLPLCRLPVYALLLCMVWSSLRLGKLFSRYGGKRYLAMLGGCAMIHGVSLACSMLGALSAGQGLACILTAVLLAFVTASGLFIGGRHHENKAAA